MNKVIDAVQVFPGSQIIIEGHTDSFGGDDMNLSLSEKRAESVRRYFIEQNAVAQDLINSIGYGETKPVANNETPQGRATNRRIDVRVIPNMDLSRT